MGPRQFRYLAHRAATEQSGSTVGQLIDAQLILERCTSATLSQGDTAELVAGLQRLRTQRPTDPNLIDDARSTIHLYRLLSQHAKNQTLRCLSAVGREWSGGTCAIETRQLM